MYFIYEHKLLLICLQIDMLLIALSLLASSSCINIKSNGISLLCLLQKTTFCLLVGRSFKKKYIKRNAYFNIDIKNCTNLVFIESHTSTSH